MKSRKVVKEMKDSDTLLAGKFLKETISEEEGKELIDPDEFLGKPKVGLLTEEAVKAIYPVKVSNLIVRRVTKAINDCLENAEEGIQYFLRDNIVSLIDIMRDNKTNSFEEYLNAVKFVTFKQGGDSNVRAFSRTFPDRVMELAEQEKPKEHLYAYANMYAKTKLVTKLFNLMMIPTHILYQDNYHQAVRVQTELMLDDNISPKVRSDEANSLMTHLKPPEVKQMELQISTKDNGAISDLVNALNNLGSSTVDMLKSGNYSMKQLREAEIIDVQVED